MKLPIVNHPTFTFQLPVSKQSLMIRPMLVKEEKILLVAKESADNNDIFNAIKQICTNCVIVRDAAFNIDSLSIVDLEYLFIRIRAFSVSNVTKVSYKDMEDDKIYDFDVDLDKIEVVDSEPKPNFNIVVDGLTITLRYPPATLYSQMGTILTAPTIDTADQILLQTVEAVSKDGKTLYRAEKDPLADLAEFVNNLDLATYDKIKNFAGSAPRLSYKIDYTNSKGSARHIELTTLNDFFTLV